MIPYILSDPVSTMSMFAPIAAASLLLLILYRSETRKLSHILTVGYNSPILSYISAIKFLFNGIHIIQEGYHKHKGVFFKVPLLKRWLVLVSGDELLGELKTGPDSLFSEILATNELFQAPYTMGSETTTNPYHIPIIQTYFGTRNLHSLFPDMRDELLTAFSEIIPLHRLGEIQCTDVFARIIARLTSRVAVGLPLCRNDEYLDNAMQYAFDVAFTSTLINIFPSFLRPLSTYVLRGPSNCINRAFKLLQPEIKRHRKVEEVDRTDDKELTLLKCLISEAKGEEKESIRLARRIMLVNFRAIYSNTATFLQALYYLAANLAYIVPLREEVEAVVSQNGWSKASMDKLTKVDSFIREAQRLHTPFGFTVTRMALKDYSFQDGTFIPENTMVCAASDAIHTDSEIYPNAGEFDGFRFSKMNEAIGSRKFEIVSAGRNDFLLFGSGKHGCPGRFFSAAEMKLLLSLIVINYDVKFENKGVRPKDMFFGPYRQPNSEAEVMLKKRESKLPTL
ncbi:cytochrome P450 [Cyathus striatus]|nr:cytochrome P450 [Cyathus striatus]